MAWKRSSVRSRPGPPNLINNLARANGHRLVICVMVCVITLNSCALGESFEGRAFGFHADVAVPATLLREFRLPRILLGHRFNA